jgi:hypothetical protein
VYTSHNIGRVIVRPRSGVMMFASHAPHCRDGSTPLKYAINNFISDVVVFLHSVGAPECALLRGMAARCRSTMTRWMVAVVVVVVVMMRLMMVMKRFMLLMMIMMINTLRQLLYAAFAH